MKTIIIVLALIILIGVCSCFNHHNPSTKSWVPLKELCKSEHLAGDELMKCIRYKSIMIIRGHHEDFNNSL